MTHARLVVPLLIAAAGIASCTGVLGYPDRVSLDELPTTPDGGGMDGAVGTDAAPPAVEGGVDANVMDGGCTGSSCPVAAYDFDEGVGTTTSDSSGNKNDGTLAGATWAEGKLGKAVSFNGGSSFVRVPSSPSLDIAGTHLSLAFWAFVVDDQSHDHVLVNKAWMNGTMNAPFYQYGVEFNRGSKTYDFLIGLSDGSGRQLSIPALPGTWTHVAFTYDGAMMRGYTDGVMIDQKAVTGSIPARGTVFRMGVDGVGAQGFSGRLDALRIYDRTLSDQEIVDLRNGK